MDVSEVILLGGTAVLAAIFGSMLGLGGGIILVPALTLFFGVDPRIAVGASAVAVALNSIVASATHIRSGFTNIRAAYVLQVTSLLGAFAGASIAIWVNPRVISLVFGLIMLYAAITLFTNRAVAIPNAPPDAPDPFRLRGTYEDRLTGRQVTYVPRRVGLGAGVSGVGGALSGMLGIGGGAITVPLMNLAMRVPMKAAVGTSQFMVGMTAVITATVFYAEGLIDPRVVLPAMVGIYIGSNIGSQLTRRIDTQRLVVVFFVVMLYLGLSMLGQAFAITLPWTA